MKYTKHYDAYQRYVKYYTAENGYTIHGNAGTDIFTSRVIPSDFWYVYDPSGNKVYSDHLLKNCKAFVERSKA